MGIRIVDVGRLELKGADARFKQKGTLEASDRNISGLKRLMVRASPSPEVHLFADFVFEGEIFRVYQDSTLINYKDFLVKVEFSGMENFRAFVRHVTAALPAHDLASREFAEKNAPPERFVSREEMAAYEAALAGGTIQPPRGKAGIDPPTSQALAEREFQKHAAALAQEAREERPKEGKLVAGTLTLMGAAMLLVSGIFYLLVRGLPEERQKVYFSLLALGGMLGVGLLAFGLVYLKKNQDLD